MCTVTYIPKSKNSYILSSNRDESTRRAAFKIRTVELNNRKITFPQDTGAGGTWISTDDHGSTLCLLNGAFERHRRSLPYRRSRGLMLLDYYSFPNAEKFIKDYTFENMEAFTLIILENKKLIEFRWDEKRSYIKHLDRDEMHIWSSTTLYDKQTRAKRALWFENWKEQGNFSKESIIEFHHFGGDGDPSVDLVMNRKNIVQTISISSIEKTQNNFILEHYNLLDRSKQVQKIELKIEDFHSS